MPAPHVTASYRQKAVPAELADFIGRREQVRIYRRFEALFSPPPSWRVLDLGVNGTPRKPEDSFFEALYPHRASVTAAGLEAPGPFNAVFPEVPYVQVGREGKLPFADGSFDLVFCSAVIEHVGSRARQRAFLEEVCRVGRRAFVTTPNRWYPVEFHTVLPLLHFLPTRVYRRAYRALGLGFFSQEENLNLLDRSALTSLLPVGLPFELHTHSFLGLPSNLLLVLRDTAARGVS